jgi:hypothetical protein
MAEYGRSVRAAVNERTRQVRSQPPDLDADVRPYFYVLVGVMMAGMPAQLIEGVVNRFTGSKRGSGES